MTSFRLSLVLSFAEKYSILFIQFTSSIILARLLSPAEIGIFSVGAVIVSFSQILRDFGASNYLIQERELTRDRIRAAQSMVLFTGWILALLLFFAAEPLAALYREPGISQVLHVLAINFVLLPFGAITVALLRREMRFAFLYGINTASAIAHATTSITLAYLGFGFMSLAWGGVASAVTTTIAAALCRRPGQPWLPGLAEWRRVLSAGSQLSGTSLFMELGLGGPELITGRVLGFEQVGYLSRAFGAANLAFRALVDVMMPVAIPFFAGQAREQADLEALFRRGQAYLSAVAWPAFACLAIGAEPIIHLLYGHQWVAAVIPLRILCLGMAILTVATISGAIIVGTGRLQLNFNIQAIFQPLKLFFVVLGAFVGLEWIATGIVAGDLALSVYSIWQVSHLLGTSATTLARSVLPSVWVTLTTSACVWLGLAVSESCVTAVVVLAIGLGAAVGWLVGLWATRHILLEEFSHIRNRVFGFSISR